MYERGMKKLDIHKIKNENTKKIWLGIIHLFLKQIKIKIKIINY